jgi:uncharacterized phage protein gp47/JayE
MPVFTTKRYEQFLAQMIAKIVTRTKLSDISDTSVVKHIIAATARQLDEISYQMYLLRQVFSIDTATGEDLDERSREIQPGLISRNAAAKSTGLLVFSRNTTVGTVTIPLGTKVRTSVGTEFITTVSGTITPTSPEQISGHGVGKDSGQIATQAVLPGISGNVVASTIIRFVSRPAGVDSVTNPSSFSWGSDKETDDSFRNRIKRFVSSLGRSTIEAIEEAVRGAVDLDTGATIMFIKAVEDIVNPGLVTVYIDDGTGAAESTAEVVDEIVTEGLSGPPAGSAVGGETRLNLNYIAIKGTVTFTLESNNRGMLDRGVDFWLNPASGQIVFYPALVTGEIITANYTRYTGLIALAQKIIDGVAADRVNYPGYRAAGVLVIVTTPQVLIQTVNAIITVLDGYDNAEVRATIKTAIRDYINTLGISGDVLRAMLIKKVMSVAGVYNVNLVTPSTDIILLDDQIARTTDENIVIS